MNISVEARHMEITEAMREYAQGKVEKFPKFFDGVQTIEVVLDMEASLPTVEIVVHATPKKTIVTHHRGGDLYACVDACADKATEQLRRHKEKLRDHKGA